jgi:hypothetical protein
MRMVTFGMVLMATVVATAWSLTTALTFTTPADGPAAMNPHEMMKVKKAGEMPIHIIVEPF